jgi:hypothetical protein
MDKKSVYSEVVKKKRPQNFRMIFIVDWRIKWNVLNFNTF